MAKGKNKPTKKAVQAVKKVEPSLKAEATVKEVNPLKARGSKQVISYKEAPKPVKIKEVEKKDSKHEFPTEEACKHSKTKRVLGRNLRATTVCVECGAVTRFGVR